MLELKSLFSREIYLKIIGHMAIQYTQYLFKDTNDFIADQKMFIPTECTVCFSDVCI